MTDTRVRARRRAADQGDEAARVAFLSERLRMGELTPDRLRLAAFCGHLDARVALGIEPMHDPDCKLVSDGMPAPSPEHEPGPLCLAVEPRTWVSALTRFGSSFGSSICVRAAWIAATQAVTDPKTPPDVFAHDHRRGSPRAPAILNAPCEVVGTRIGNVMPLAVRSAAGGASLGGVRSLPA